MLQVVFQGELLVNTHALRGVARILGKGVLEFAHEQNFKPRQLINRQGRSSNSQREYVLDVAIEVFGQILG